MLALQQAGIPFLVGGGFAMRVHAGIERETKDLDLFLRPEDLEGAFAAAGKAAYRTELTYPHWLGKVFAGCGFTDLIFGAGNGMCQVDDTWFTRARRETVLDVEVLVCPVEETIWLKAFIMERERFDGPDVAHLILHSAERIDWDHLRRRFGSNWEVLLSHLVLFRYIYPSEAHRLPARLFQELLRHASESAEEAEISRTELPGDRVCYGTLLSQKQFLPDIERWDFADGRIAGGRRIAGTRNGRGF